MTIEDIGRHDAYKDSMPELPLPIYYERIEMTQPTDKVREAFEVAFPSFDFRRAATNGSTYRDAFTYTAYSIWQASRTAALNEAILLLDAQGLHLLMSPPPQQALKDLRDGK